MLHRMSAEEAEKHATATQPSTESDNSNKPADSESKSSFRIPFHKRHSSSPDTAKKEKEKADGLAHWLREGTVIYKSVGLGLMDLVCGNHLVKLARDKNIGTQVPGF